MVAIESFLSSINDVLELDDMIDGMDLALSFTRAKVQVKFKLQRNSIVR